MKELSIKDIIIIWESIPYVFMKYSLGDLKVTWDIDEEEYVLLLKKFTDFVLLGGILDSQEIDRKVLTPFNEHDIRLFMTFLANDDYIDQQNFDLEKEINLLYESMSHIYQK